MNFLRQAAAASALTLVLALSAYAGEMGAGITSTDNTETSNSATTSSTTDGEMGAGITETIAPVTEVTLSLLQNASALF